MKKEVLIAIVIGFGLGLVITFGIWSANKAMKEGSSEVTPTPAVINTQPTPTPEPITDLKIIHPPNNFLSDKEAIELEGQTHPKSIVVIIYPEGEKILQSDDSGDFATEIDLAGGVNEIKVMAFDNSGNEFEQKVEVVYSTAEI